jgi:hypothetical protein
LEADVEKREERPLMKRRKGEQGRTAGADKDRRSRGRGQKQQERKGGVIEEGGVEENWRSRVRGAEDRSRRKERRSNRGRWSRGGLEE